jgi:hypothetical protein
VTRSVSGDATDTMQRHYSTVDDNVQRAALAKAISLATYGAESARVNLGHPIAAAHSPRGEHSANLRAGDGIRALDVNLGNVFSAY